MQDVVEYGARRTVVVAAAMLAALMQLADTTIVNVALPTVDGALGASTDQGAWFITAYIIANVIVIPLTPWFQTIMGRKNYFATAIAGFTLFSMLCGLVSDTNLEILMRFIQGAFGGGLMVPAQQIIRDTFPAKDLAKSQSLFMMAAVLGPTIGPTLGGVLTDGFSWRWIFFVNAVPGIVATILVLMFVRDPAPPKRISFDLIGVSLMAVGLGCLQYVLDEGERDGWFDDSRIVIASVVCVIALIAFVFYELYGTKTPGVAIRIFKQRSVWSMSIIFFAVAAGIYALVFIQPQWSQVSLGYTTTLAGLLLMVRAGALVVLYPITTWVTSREKWDMRIVACVGIIVAGAASYFQANVMTTDTPFGALVFTQAMGGVGYAFIWAPLTVALFKAVAPMEIPAALALTRLIQQIGASVGSAYAATLLDRGYDEARSALAGNVTANHANVASAILQHGQQALNVLDGLVTQQAMNIAAADATRFFGIATIACAFLPFILARTKVAVAAPVANKPSATPAAQKAA